MRKNRKRIFIDKNIFPKELGYVLKVAILSAGFIFSSGKSIAQHQSVSLDMEQSPIEEVFISINRQTGLDFVYNSAQLKNMKPISIHVKNVSVDSVLSKLFSGTPFEHKFEKNSIVIRSRKEGNKTVVKGIVRDPQGEPLPGVTIVLKGSMTGTSSDSHGKFSLSIPEVKEGKSVILVFSFIGMKTREVIYKKTMKSLNIVMEETVNQLEEAVVNTGYQTINSRNLTSAVTSIKAEDIMVPGMTTIDQMLEGHVPGMTFLQNSGQLGAAPRLRIRGTSTVLGNREPLWVVDGIVQTDPVNVDPQKINDLDFVNLLGNAISGLNPEDIEQIDVLKDASATAIYGAKAANGVIVITTKKGKKGAPSITYSLTGSFAQRPRYSDRGVYMMNSSERIDFSRELIRKGHTFNNMNIWVGYEKALRDYYNGKLSYEEFKKEVNYYERINTDWFGILLQDAFSHNHTLSLSGGTENVRYYTSVGYSDQVGVLKGEKNKRYTANIRVNADYKRFAISFGISGRVSEKKYTPQNVGLLNYAYNTSRAIPATAEDGSLWYYDRPRSRDGMFTYKFNIVNERDNSRNTIDGEGFSFNTNIKYRITKGLRLGATLAYGTDNTVNETYYGEKTFYIANLRRGEYGKIGRESECPYGGELKHSSTKNKNYMLRLQFDYNTHLDETGNHKLNASLGGEISSVKYTGLDKTFRGYLPERGKMITPIKPGDYEVYAEWLTRNPNALGILKDQLTNKVSSYVSASYIYKNFFVFNFNSRIDASNKFGQKSNKRLLPIWSVSSRWNISECLLPEVHWVNEIALKTSFGYQGNMLHTQSPELIIKKGNLNNKFEEYESTIFNFANPYLRWEKTMSTNTSLDFSLFKNKLRGTVSFFYKKTKDAFMDKSVSEINGVTKYTVNRGTLVNKGFEFSFNITPVSTRAYGGEKQGFSWRIDPQFGQIINNFVDKAASRINKRDRKEYALDEITYTDYLTGRIPIPGYPLNTFFSYKFAGLDPEDGRPMFKDIDPGRRQEFLDMKDKEAVFLEVMTKSGNRIPVIQGGVSNTFSYRRFVLSFNIAYSFGSKIRLLQMYPNVRQLEGTIAPNPLNNVRREFLNRWRQPGDEKYTTIPGIINTADFSSTLRPWWTLEPYAFASNIWAMYDASDLRVVNGNYVKLQSFSFRYSIPESLCKRVYLKAAYLSISGSNLFTISSRKLKGQLPTQSGGAPNIPLSLRPTWACTMNVTF